MTASTRPALLTAALTILLPNALAADSFQRLSGPQIQAKFAGMEMTDEVHWSDVYGRNGTLTTYEMGDKRVDGVIGRRSCG